MQWQQTEQVLPHGHGEDFYTWREFRENVLDLCPIDRNRLGLQRYLPMVLREAVIDLQQFVASYQNRHENLWYHQDFAIEGHASVGTLPPKADIQSIWICDLSRSHRFPVKHYPWEKRFNMVYRDKGPVELFPNLMVLTAAAVQAIELIDRLPALQRVENGQHGLIAIDPQAETFYLSPQMRPGWVLDIHWHGRKLDFKDNELVPFDEETAMAVASWVKSKVALQVDRDRTRAMDFMAEYYLARTNLYITLKEQAAMLSK
jgi:hypothetical protein